MFHVGRYDPKKEERKRGQTDSSGHSRNKRRKRPRNNERSEEKLSEKGDEHSWQQPDITPLRTDQKSNDSESDSSSSVPSSSEESEDVEKTTSSTLRVIAPKADAVAAKPMKLGLSDEGFDDFDVDAELLDTNVNDEKDVGVEDQADSKVDDSELPDGEIKTALHMSTLPIEEAAAAWDLAPFLIENLKRHGYKSFFPIQSLVIPDVIASERHSHIRARDVCVAAPTGSGKTLVFVLLVLNALANRQIRRLRALVILPSRDLASQVYQVFERYTQGSDLRVGLAIGQSDFEAEQRALTVGPLERFAVEDPSTVRRRYALSNENLDLALEAFPGVSDAGAPPKDGGLYIPKGGISAVDVLVATPGRLVDHLDRTPGFTLQHLRFCVIDEADRLVNQSYHNWIGRVIASANEASIAAWHDLASSDGSSTLKLSSDRNFYVIDPITWRRGGKAGDASAFSNNENGNSAVAAVCHPVQLRKLLFSATLTKDPKKLASLGLVNPKHYDAHHLGPGKRSSQHYSMPAALSEYSVECTAEQKPLVLLSLLLTQLQKDSDDVPSDRSIIAVFTSSLDSTHRLVRLLQLLWSAAGIGDPSSVTEFSSALNQSQRTDLMKRCTDADGDASVIVCSDGMSRGMLFCCFCCCWVSLLTALAKASTLFITGMDIPSVSAVFNYDVPSFAKTYVHRCGRTARAGKKGIAISVLKGGQVKQFQRMRQLIDDPGRVKEMKVNKDIVRDAVKHYRACVKALRAVIQAEEDGDISTTDAIPVDFIPS